MAMAAGAIHPGRLGALRAREDAAFTARIPRSRALAEEAARVMPSAVPMAWMAGCYRHPPLYVAGGEGARFRDVDGNVYLDFNQADLSMNCGFGPPAVADAVDARFRKGSSFLLPTEDAIAVSRALGARFGLSFWQYTLSASAANAEAIRLARLATGREGVVFFAGKYHGHTDELLVAGDEAGCRPELLGLRRDAGRGARMVPFNDRDALARALGAGDIACIVTEPALTNVGVVLPEPGFLEDVRDLANTHGSLLILDETHTHMAAYGGLTRAWGLAPDMVTLGKSLGGGVPIGAWGMTEALAETMSRHLDSDIDPRPGLAAGGTMYANALSLAAARAALDHVLTVEGYARVARLGARLADGIEALIATHDLPWRAHRLGGRSGFCLAPELPRDAAQAAVSLDPELIDGRRIFMANRGLWDAIASAGPAASFAHEEADIDAYLAALAEFLAEIVAD